MTTFCKFGVLVLVKNYVYFIILLGVFIGFFVRLLIGLLHNTLIYNTFWFNHKLHIFSYLDDMFRYKVLLCECFRANIKPSGSNWIVLVYFKS